MEDFLTFGGWFEAHDSGLEFGHDGDAAQWAFAAGEGGHGFVDGVIDVFLEDGLEFGALGFRVTGDGAVESAEGGCFAADEGFDGIVVLVGGDGEEAEEESEEDAEGEEAVAEEFVGAGFRFEDISDERAEEDDPEPEDGDDGTCVEDGDAPEREFIDA